MKSNNNPFKGAGIASPVFSLRTKNGCGTGEFPDLKPLSDWASDCGFTCIQILPVNDTTVYKTWQDSYPYSSISVFALHPLYLNLQSITKLPKKIQDEIKEKQKTLNSSKYLEYEETIKFKFKTIKEIFEIEKEKTINTPSFKSFIKENAYWLGPYSAFSVLRDKYKTCDYTKWGKYAVPSKKDIEEITSPKSIDYENVVFYYFIQYHLHLQLQDASLYAKQKGISLKGDIAIGMHKQSDSCWAMPGLFHLDQLAGAPPDPFSDDGQNWSFPTYNWEAMKQNNYLWWRQRMKHMSQYFHMVRLDHVLGFFRIWEIPECHISGLMGHFNPVIPIPKTELEQSGIWDFNRLCEPFIPSWLLEKLFGEDAKDTAKIFLTETKKDFYSLKPEFLTQRQVENYFTKTSEKTSYKNKKIRDGLFTLISNIIFFRDKNKEGFHPRINMMNTISFASLENWEKDKLKNFYYDYFYHRQNDLWQKQGMIKLPVLQESSDILICGEDLGMIPDCVPPVLEKLGILGLRIQRMPKEPNQEFGIPKNYTYLTVCSTSSHDMSTIRGWWEEDAAKAKRYYNNILGHNGTSPSSCTPELCKEIIIQHLESPSMWAIFPIQDILGMSEKLCRRGDPKEEQINDPSNPRHLWRFRLHIDIEELIKDKTFSKNTRELINASNR